MTTVFVLATLVIVGFIGIYAISSLFGFTCGFFKSVYDAYMDSKQA